MHQISRWRCQNTHSRLVIIIFVNVRLCFVLGRRADISDEESVEVGERREEKRAKLETRGSQAMKMAIFAGSKLRVYIDTH